MQLLKDEKANEQTTTEKSFCDISVADDIDSVADDIDMSVLCYLVTLKPSNVGRLTFLH